MEFRLLGPLEAAENGRRIPLGGPRQRTVLAHLLVRANQVVSTDRLIEDVWGGGGAPEAARNALQSYVSRLRHVLGDGARIEGRSPGYVLHVSQGELDALRFEALLAEGRRALPSDPDGAAEKLEEALGLWRGPPLADLADELSLRPEIGRLEELRLAALEERFAADLARGRHAEIVGELEALAAEHRLRERLWGRLMLALYRCGRQADALAAYRRARSTLADELGIDPSPELRRLEGQILRHDPALEAGGTPLRGYRLGEQIGRGSFGAVFRATQPHVGREVAVKVIRPELADDPRFIRRFEAEAQLVARLEHPHVVPLYDYWREPGAAYLVMRWFRGGSLRDELVRGHLGFDRAARTLEQVASGLAVAHRQGVVHRDVKPANILLDEEGNAYLSDFGIATDVVGGTPETSDPDSTPYVSPEQLRGEPATLRTDVYSLGVLLRKALAPGESTPAIDELVRRATSEDPGDRYRDADELAVALRDAVGRARARLDAGLRNPFKGLRPFHEADTDDFFGREALTERLVARMAGSGPSARFLVLVGASGSGKSSVVRAGLVPALRRGAVAGSQSWFVVETTPGARPLEELEATLLRIAAEPSQGLGEDLGADERGLVQAVRRILPPAAEMLLLVDQLEEVFTLVEDEEHRAHFLRSLVAAATEPGSPIRIVATLRGDFYDRPLRYRGLAELVRSGTEAVVPLSPDEVERAVARPAERAGIALEPGLVQRIVADVTDQPGSLPLLQYTLTELFERRRDRTLKLDAYRAVGGVSGALVRRAEELYGALDEDAKAAARQLFLRLVTLGEGAEDTRRRVPRAEVLSVEPLRTAMERVVDGFGRFRLLSFDRDPQTREPTVEVAHEALLREWGRLRGWIDGARDDVGMHRRLAAAAAEWAAAGRDPSFLLRGTRLEQLEAWAHSSQLALAAAEENYLSASAAARDEERAAQEARRARESALERRSLSRLRALVAVLGLAALVAAVLTLFAFGQRGEAREEAERAEREAGIATARELASAAVANVEGDPELSILLALEAVEAGSASAGRVKEAEEALHRAVQASRVVLTVPGLFGLAFSPDGSRIATTNVDGTARIWDVETGEELVRLRGHRDRTLSVDFNGDGTLIATSSADATAKVWDAETGEELQTFVGHEDGLRSPHFSPDGRVLATTSFDGTMRLWDVETGEERLVLQQAVGGMDFSPDGKRLVASGPPIAVYEARSGRRLLSIREEIPDPRDAAWSSDGRRIAVSDGDGFGYVFDVETGERLLTLVGHTARSVIGEIDFSSDDTRLVTSGSDGTVRLWDAATGLELLSLRGLQGNVEGSAVSPDGTLVAGSSGSGIAKVWDVTGAGSRELLTIPAHRDVVYGLGFSPDGTRLAAGSADGSASVWDPLTGEELVALDGIEWRVEDLAVSPDGSRLLTAGERTAVWDARRGEPLLELDTGAPTIAVAFSPDGNRLLTGGEDGIAILWDAATGRELLRLERHALPIFSVAFSRDGTRIATAGQDETAKVWDATTGEELASMMGHEDNVNAVAFSPDGRRLFTAGEDGPLKVWDAASGRELDSLTGHGAGLLDVVLSPDGRRLATAGRDGSVKLWDPRTHRELLTLRGHASGVSAVAFGPDGARLAAAGEDGSLRLFTLQIDELTALARARVTRALTDEECRRYLHLERCPR